MISIYDGSPLVEGCRFEQIDGDKTIPKNTPLKCAVCLGMFAGDAILEIDNEGFTNVTGGMCMKYGISAQIPFKEQLV